jgi:hypothetical protein
MDNFNIGVPFTLLGVSLCTTKKNSFFHFLSLLIFGVSPKYHRIKNEKNEARPFKREMPIKMHVSHLQNGLPFVEERFH